MSDPPARILDLRSAESRIIVLRAQAGDARALDAVLRALQEPLYAHILGIVRDATAARDTLQDTLLIIARKLSHLDEPRWIRAWAYRIATREAVRHARLTKRWKAELTDDVLDQQHAPVPDEPRYDPELVAYLPTLVTQLPPASQAVLRMHYLDEMTYPEIAEALEISIGTVKSRVAYGLKRLRAGLRLRSSQ